MMALDLEPVELDAVVTNAIRLVADRARAAGITLEASKSGNPGLVADRRRLQQMLLNLLSNAIKFTDAGGRVTLSVEQPCAGMIDLVVADTGIGIAPEDLARVMEPFFVGENTLVRKREGTGLGLALVKQMAELHGGSLELSSAPGKGTVATLRLPLEGVRAGR